MKKRILLFTWSLLACLSVRGATGNEVSPDAVGLRGTSLRSGSERFRVSAWFESRHSEAPTEPTHPTSPTPSIAVPACGVTIIGANTYCVGGGSTSLTAMVSGFTSSAVTYQWRLNGTNLAGATGGVYSANATGTYSVVVGGTGCGNVTTTSANFAVAVAQSTPTANPIVGSPEFCSGGSATLTASATGGTGPYTVQWRQGSLVVGSGPTFNATVADDYLAVITDAAGCTTTAPFVSVKENPQPVANAGPDVFRTGTEKLVITGPSASGGTPPYTYTWTTNPTVAIDNPGSATPTIGPFTGNTTVRLTVADSKNCVAQKQAIVVYSSCAFAVTVLAKGAFCQGSSDTLRAQLTGGGGGYVYSWRRGAEVVSTEERYPANQAGAYSVTVDDSRGCRATSNPVQVQENPSPTLTISGATSFCKGTNSTLTATATDGTGPYSIQWLNGTTPISSAAALTVGVPGLYSAFATDARGCRATANPAQVQENPGPTATITGVASFCKSASTTLTASATGGAEPYTVQWLNGTTLVGSTATLTVGVPGSYTASATDARGCRATATPVQVQENPSPAVTISGAASFCKGASTTLTATATGGTAPYSIQWVDGTTPIGNAAALILSATGFYTVTATDARGCASTPASVNVREKGGDLTALILPVGPTEVIAPAVVTLNANAGLSLNYQWRVDGRDIPGATGISYVVSQAGTSQYTVVVYQDGCFVVSPPLPVSIRVATALDPVSLSTGFELRLAPNPTTGRVRVDVTLERPEILRLFISDLSGRRIATELREKGEVRHTFEVNLGELADGLYLLRAETDSGQQSRKLVKR